MDLIAVMTYISLLAVVVVFTIIDSNACTSCNGPYACNGCNSCNGHTSCNNCIGCNGQGLNGSNSCNDIHFSIGSSSCIDYN